MRHWQRGIVDETPRFGIGDEVRIQIPGNMLVVVVIDRERKSDRWSYLVRYSQGNEVWYREEHLTSV